MRAALRSRNCRCQRLCRFTFCASPLRLSRRLPRQMHARTRILSHTRSSKTLAPGRRMLTYLLRIRPGICLCPRLPCRTPTTHTLLPSPNPQLPFPWAMRVRAWSRVWVEKGIMGGGLVSQVGGSQAVGCILHTQRLPRPRQHCHLRDRAWSVPAGINALVQARNLFRTPVSHFVLR